MGVNIMALCTKPSKANCLKSSTVTSGVFLREEPLRDGQTNHGQKIPEHIKLLSDVSGGEGTRQPGTRGPFLSSRGGECS